MKTEESPKQEPKVPSPVIRRKPETLRENRKCIQEASSNKPSERVNFSRSKRHFKLIDVFFTFRNRSEH